MIMKFHLNPIKTVKEISVKELCATNLLRTVQQTDKQVNSSNSPQKNLMGEKKKRELPDNKAHRVKGVWSQGHRDQSFGVHEKVLSKH